MDEKSIIVKNAEDNTTLVVEAPKSEDPVVASSPRVTFEELKISAEGEPTVVENSLVPVPEIATSGFLQPIEDPKYIEDKKEVVVKPSEFISEVVTEKEKPKQQVQPPQDFFTIDTKNIKLWKSLERRKKALFRQASALLNGIDDPMKLSRRNRRAFIRVNNKFVDLDNQSKALEPHSQKLTVEGSEDLCIASKQMLNNRFC